MTRFFHVFILAALLLVGGLGFDGCSDELDDGQCRSTADCSGDQECATPNAPQVCGIPPREECATNDDCPGTACHAIADTCSPDGVGSECRATCLTDTECGGNFRCNTTDSTCEPLPCDEGYTCPDYQVCDTSIFTDATPVHARHHGCVDITCAADADCIDAAPFCVNSVCRVGLGACQTPMLVP